MLTLDHHHASEEVQKEKEYLVNQVKELDKGSVLMDDYQVSSVFSAVHYIWDFQSMRRISVEDTFLYCYTYTYSYFHLQILRNQLLVLMKERDKGMTQIEEKQCHDVEVEKKVGCFCCFLSRSLFICSLFVSYTCYAANILGKTEVFFS